MKCIVFALNHVYLRGVELWGVLTKASNAVYPAVAMRLLVRFQQKK